MDLIYYGSVGNGRMLLPVPFLALLVMRLSGTALLILMTCRACPSLVPRKKDLKKLFDGPSRYFWYSVEEDKYLEASALGSDVVMKKIFVGRLAYLMTIVSTYLALITT